MAIKTPQVAFNEARAYALSTYGKELADVVGHLVFEEDDPVLKADPTKKIIAWYNTKSKDVVVVVPRIDVPDHYLPLVIAGLTYHEFAHARWSAWLDAASEVATSQQLRCCASSRKAESSSEPSTRLTRTSAPASGRQSSRPSCRASSLTKGRSRRQVSARSMLSCTPGS
jgi:hypothetical protein